MADGYSGLAWTDLEQTAFKTAQEAEEKIFGALSGYGWSNKDDVTVRPARDYSGGKWHTVDNEFDLTVTHPLAPSGQQYYARIKGAPNETVLRKVGKQFQHYTGDTKDVAPSGFSHLKDTQGNPFYTGVQSFARRIAAGLGETLERRLQYPNDDRINWQNTVHEIDFVQKNVSGGNYPMPVVDDATKKYKRIQDNIPLANVMHEPNVSKENIRFMAGTLGVPLIAGAERAASAISALERQVNEWGRDPRSPFARLFGSAVFEPSQNTGGRLVTPWAAGSMYTTEQGITGADMIATTPMKHTYSVGRRPVAKLGMLSGTRLTELDPRHLTDPSLTMRSGEQSDPGLRVQALTAITPKTLPWQSGQMQVSLPTELQQEMRSKRGELVAMSEARRTLQLQGVSGPEELLRVPFRLSDEYLGKTLPQGSQYPIDIVVPDYGDIDPKSAAGKKLAGQISTRQITPRNQIEQITGFTLLYPQAWKERMSEEQLGSFFREFEEKGFTSFQPHAADQPYVQVDMLSATPVGPKGGGSKGQVDTPLIGVSQTLRTGQGGLSYNVLQEAKHPESVLYNALQAMPKEQIPELLATLYKGQPQMAGMVEKANLMVQSGAPLSLQDIGSSVFPTGEQTLLSISRALEGYGDQQELISRFGLGYQTGRAPVNQYTPETWKYLRESVVNDLMTNKFSVDELTQMGFSGETAARPLTQREAMRQWRNVYSSQAEYDKDTGLYTHFAEQKFLYHPKKQTFHQETVGVGSLNEMELGIRAQGMSGAADFIRNMLGMEGGRSKVPETPAKWGIKQITRGWMATQFGDVVDPGGTEIITPEVAQQVKDIMGQLILTPKYADRGKLGAMEAYGQAFRLATGIGGQEEPLYHFPSSKTTIAGAEAFGETESLLTELRGEGMLVPQTQAHVASRWVRAVSTLLESEARGQSTLEGMHRAQSLSGTYIDSEQIRKTKGGLFARYGGSTLLSPGEVAVSEQALRRHYLMQGGRGRGKEWNRYLEVMNNATAVGVRAPAPNIGTKDMPGSIFPLIMRTEQSKIGKMIFGAYREAGIRAPDFILSTLQRAQQGDVDLDPATLLPLAYRIKRNGAADWVKYQGEGDYGEWMREVFGLQSVQAQQNTFQQIFGANAQSFDPWSSRMREAVKYSMGAGGTSLLDKRLAVETQGLQEHIRMWNRVKQREMGSMYNAIIRRANVAATTLGMPDEALTFTRDIGIAPYQTSIDLEIPKSPWAALMGTSGFFPQVSSTTGELSLNWGWNVNFLGDKPDFSTGMSYWNPTQDVKYLASHVGRILASDPNANPEFVASMIMQQPERQMDIGRRSDEEMNRIISQRREQVAGVLRDAMNVQGDERTLAINDAVRDLQRMGLIGERSVGVQSLMARSLEYMNKDATRKQMTIDAINQQGGLLYGGKRLSAEDWIAQTKPMTTLYSWQKHEPGTAAPYKNVLDIAELMLESERGAYRNAPYMEEFVRQWGEMAGFRPGRPVEVKDPYTGQLRIVQSREDIQELRAAAHDVRTQMVDQWIQGGGQGAVRRLSFSALGSQAQIAESGSIYEDMYNQSLTGAMMYGFSNPVLGTENIGVNVTAPQQLGRYFKTGSMFTAAGDRVESMFALANRQRGRPLGTHIGQVSDYTKVPRYEVQGQNARYDIAGIPDFLKFSRGQNAGEYEVDVYDVKNLSRLKGMRAGAAIKDIKENPAYATQVPGYQTMLADLPWLTGDSEGAQNMRAMIREQLSDNPEQLEIFEEMLKEGKNVTARGAYLASRYTPEEAMRAGGARRSMISSIGAGIDKLTGGATQFAGRGRGAPGMVRAEMPVITTADVPEQQQIIAGKAEQAQGMARSLALQASLYQSYAIKQHIMGSESLKLQFGEQEFTPAEEEAARFWQTKGREGETRYYERNPLQINPNISDRDLLALRYATDINLEYLSGGQIPTGQAGGTGPPNRGGPPTTIADLPDPEEPGRRRRSTQSVREELAGARNIDQETLLKMFDMITGKEGGKGIRTMFGRKTPMTSKQLSNFYGAFEEFFKSQIGTQTVGEGYQPGELVRQFQNIPEMLSSQFSGTQATQLRGLDPQLALVTAQAFAQEQGVSFAKVLEKSGVGGLLNTWNALEGMGKTLMPNLGKLDENTTGGRGSFTQRAMMALFGGSESEAQGLSNTQGFAPFMNAAPGTFEAGRKLKSAFTTGGTPAGEFASIAEAWQKTIGGMADQLDKTTDKLIKTEKGFKDLDDMLDKTTMTTEKKNQVLQRQNVLEERRMAQWKSAVSVRGQYKDIKGFDAVRGRGMALTPEELQFISEKGVPTEEAATALERYWKSYYDRAQGRAGVAFTAADRQVPGEQGGFKPQGFARMGRAMLGGFGLMYLRSVWDIATQGSQMGLEPYMQQQQAIQQQMGQAIGYMPFMESGQQELARAQAPYGGAGLQQLQRLQARIAQDPGRAGVMSAGGAALAAIGAGTWMGSMIGMPWLGLAGAPIAAGGALALQAWGAKSEPEISGVGIASRLWTGEAGYGDVSGWLDTAPLVQQDVARIQAQPDSRFQWGGGGALSSWIEKQFASVISSWQRTGALDPTLAGWQESPEAQEITQTLMNLKRMREQDLQKPEDQRRNYTQIMRDLGMKESDIARYEGFVAQATGSAMAIPFEGIVGAQMLERRYGIALGQEEGGAFETLATALSQGAAWPTLAQAAGETAYTTREEADAETARLLKEWSQTGMSEADAQRLGTGRDRMAALGTAAPDLRGKGLQAFRRRLGGLSEAGYGLMRQEYQMGAQLRQMGLPWRRPGLGQFENLSQADIVQMQREQGVRGQRVSMMGQAYQGMLQLGFDQPAMTPYLDMSSAQISNQVRQIAGAFGVQQQLELAGAPNAQEFGQALGLMQGKIGQTMLGVLGGDRRSWAEYALQRPDEFAQLMFSGPLPGAGGGEIMPYLMGMTDIRETPDGQQMTGMQWGTSSLAMPGISSAVMAGQIWGGDYAGRSDVSQGLIGAMISGGTFGGQMYQLQQQAQHTQAMAGIQLEQIALNRTFQTGVGLGQYTGIVNPQTGQPFGFHTGAFGVNVQGVGGFRTEGGGLWGVQDAMRGLGYMQQEWQFGRQREQLDMQDRFWQQNFNLNRRQSMMQRPWRREDWAFQDQQRALQWGWRQEDFQEESRFMTGRDRRLAERQMERDTIMYGMEGEQIDKQRERQEELWKLEDERFMIQEQQHKEQLQFQEEGIKTQQKFYEERKRLTEEQYKLQRAFQIRQMELSEKQAQASAAYAAEQQKIAQTMAEFSQFSQEASAQGNLFNEKTLDALADALEDINPELAKLIRQLRDAVKDAKNATGDDDGGYVPPDDDVQGPRQHGGYVQAHQQYLVGEAGAEMFRPYLSGEIVPNHKLNPFDNTVISPQDTGSGASQLIHLVLNLGDQHFREYIIETVDSEIDV